jgi:LCP family protein required for cell wall assembly
VEALLSNPHLPSDPRRSPAPDASELEDTIPPQRIDALGAASPALAPAPRRRLGFWKVLGLTALLATGASAYYLTQTKHGRDAVRIAAPVISGVIQERQNPGLLFTQAHSDVVNILLVGRDVNYKQVYDKQGRNIAHVVDKDTPARSDTMIIVSLDRIKKTIRMVSLPRDTLMYIPAKGDEAGVQKINAAHSIGGIPLLKKTLHDELGLTIHHHAVIKFEGFKQVIDQMGGIYVDVLGALKRDGTRGPLKYEDKWGGWKVDLKPGKQWLNGEQAHGYVRFRMDIEGDPGRIQRQQSVMRALARRMKEISPLQLPGVIDALKKQFETDLSESQLVSAGFFAKEEVGETNKIQPITLYGVYTSKGSVRLNKPRNEALMATIFGPSFNPDNFLRESPWTRRYDFGPDEKKPESRAVLREAGLIEGGRIAARTSGSSSSSEIVSSPGTSSGSQPAQEFNDPFAPQPSNVSPSVPRDQPRRRVRREEARSVREREAPAEPQDATAQASQEPAPLSEAQAPDQAQSPLPQAEAGDLSVEEGPIPQPE